MLLFGTPNDGLKPVKLLRKKGAVFNDGNLKYLKLALNSDIGVLERFCFDLAIFCHKFDKTKSLVWAEMPSLYGPDKLEIIFTI